MPVAKKIIIEKHNVNVKIDRNRMTKALKSSRIPISTNLSREEKRALILSYA